MSKRKNHSKRKSKSGKNREFKRIKYFFSYLLIWIIELIIEEMLNKSDFINCFISWTIKLMSFNN